MFLAPVLALALGTLAGCAGQADNRDVQGSEPLLPATASANPAGPAGRATTGRAMPYTLRTHCGIDEARIGATYYEAKTPLSDGSGNPPNGWGIPSRRAP